MKPSIYQLKVTLRGCRPPVWRRLLVPSSMDLATLHAVLQAAMGWGNCHLHQFVAAGEFYGNTDPDFGCGPEVLDERKVRLDRLLSAVKDWIVYEYDFGDGWVHKIVLEKVLPFDKNAGLPRCIGGKRACPPEDCGGAWGYANLLDCLKDPDHPEREEMLEWVGEDWDPEALDIEEADRGLTRFRT